MSENKRVSIPQAAKELGMSAQGLREHIKRGYLGHVLPSPTGKTHNYFIFRDELEQFKKGQTEGKQVNVQKNNNTEFTKEELTRAALAIRFLEEMKQVQSV